ncbi:MAG TPA: diacylglycerol kinase family protein [Bacteroidales bacterium]|nr:diacylglycerol kinase family protein [Bacteroidales bacterium]
MVNPKKKQPFNIRQRISSFGYAFKGLRYLLVTQHNARIHLVATILVIAAAFYFRLAAAEWILLLIVVGMVWAAEAINTALELLIDLVSPQKHPLAGHAKDVAAAAVLITAIIAALVGVILFLPHIINRFFI